MTFTPQGNGTFLTQAPLNSHVLKMKKHFGALLTDGSSQHSKVAYGKTSNFLKRCFFNMPSKARMVIRTGSNHISHYLQGFSSQVRKFWQPPQIIYLLGVICSALHHYFCLSVLPASWPQHTVFLLDYRSNPLLVSPETPCVWYQLSWADNGVTNSFPFWCSAIQAVVQVFMSQSFFDTVHLFCDSKSSQTQNEPDKCWQHEQQAQGEKQQKLELGVLEL